jgi:hypothetical protein
MKNFTFSLIILCLFGIHNLSGSNPPPIQLIYFNAEMNDEHEVDLTWAIAVEINNDFFTVESTTDGITYRTIAIVDGYGSSSQQHNYSAVDIHPTIGVSYYRLKQTDLNGSSTYSDIQMINNEHPVTITSSVYPNPSTGNELNVNVDAIADERIKLSLVNAAGTECYSSEFVADSDGVNSFRIVFPATLSPGIYLLYITNDSDQTEPFKIMVQ